jgi:sulfur carrier protein ThiS
MDRVIIGSSNVYRFYRPELYKDFKTYNVARCTDLTTFKAIMENLGVEETGVVVSVLENFLERSIVGETETEALLEGMGNTMTEFMKIVRNAASRLPNSKFILADPIKRPKCAPYQEHFEDILLAFGEGFDFRRMDNITRMEGIAEG